MQLKASIDYLRRIPFVRDVMALQVGNAVGLANGLLTSVLYLRLLGQDSYGTYAVVLAFTATFTTVVNWGQAAALSTFFAEQYGRRNQDGMAHVLGYYAIMTAFSGCLIGLMMLAAPPLAIALYSDTTVVPLARLSFAVIFLNAIPGVLFAVLQTVREVKTMTFIDQSINALHLAVSSILLLLGYGVASIFVSRIILLLLLLPLLVILYRRLAAKYGLPPMRSVFAVRLRNMREYFVQGFWIGIDKNIGNLYPNLFFTIISTVAPRSTVGIARIAFQLSGLPRMLLLNAANQMAGTVLPTIAGRGHAVLRQTCARLLKHALFFHAVLSLGTIVVLPVAIVLLYGHKNSAVITPTLLLTLISILSALNVNNTPILRLFRKTWVSTLWSAGSIAISSLLLWALLRAQPPLTALIAATLAYYVVNQGITLYIYVILLQRQPPGSS